MEFLLIGLLGMLVGHKGKGKAKSTRRGRRVVVGCRERILPAGSVEFSPIWGYEQR